MNGQIKHQSNPQMDKQDLDKPLCFRKWMVFGEKNYS